MAIAEVIPLERNENLAQAECPECERTIGRPSSWWSIAQERADAHNRRFHAEEIR